MKLNFFTQHREVPKNSCGFTMIELLISITIFTILSGVVLAKYGTFSNNTEFANAAESVVLALRQAQVYGVASKSSQNGSGTAILCPPLTGSTFDCVYGVHFSANLGENNKIIIFIDENGDYIYQAASEVAAETIVWGAPIVVSKLRCEGVDCILGKTDITFRRPNPDGFIADTSPCSGGVYSLPEDTPSCKDFYGDGPNVNDSKDVAEIELTNGEKFATITITSTGQISLK